MRRVIVTRPVSEAPRWVSALQARGWMPVALPLLATGPAHHQQPWPQVTAQIADCDALMFVSTAAVEHFFVATGIDPCALPRCWAPGPATARALQAVGVSASGIDQPHSSAAQYDSEALWQVVQPQVHVGHRLLVVRGQSLVQGGALEHGQGRDWLAQQCVACGGHVDWCVAYWRFCPAWDVKQMQQAQLALTDGSIWLLSSSEAIRNLPTLLPHAQWSSVPALVTHPRMVMAAAQVGFQPIHVARPALPDVLAALEMMRC